MKKILGACAVCVLSVLLSACGNQNMVKNLAETGSAGGNVTRNGEAQGNVEDSSEEVTVEEAETSGEMVDLTVLNSTMVYSEVYDMMIKPETYKGKMIRMKGNFSVYEGESRRYFSCIIQDATACCAQGLEFELKGEHKYPEDYPKENDEITVSGIFDTYKEGENTYCVIKDAVFS